MKFPDQRTAARDRTFKSLPVTVSILDNSTAETLTPEEEELGHALRQVRLDEIKTARKEAESARFSEPSFLELAPAWVRPSSPTSFSSFPLMRRRLMPDEKVLERVEIRAKRPQSRKPGSGSSVPTRPTAKRKRSQSTLPEQQKRPRYLSAHAEAELLCQRAPDKASVRRDCVSIFNSAVDRTGKSTKDAACQIVHCCKNVYAKDMCRAHYRIAKWELDKQAKK